MSDPHKVIREARAEVYAATERILKLLEDQYGLDVITADLALKLNDVEQKITEVVVKADSYFAMHKALKEQGIEDAT